MIHYKLQLCDPRVILSLHRSRRPRWRCVIVDTRRELVIYVTYLLTASVGIVDGVDRHSAWCVSAADERHGLD